MIGEIFAALYAAHQVADHWVQTQHQANHKGAPGWAGRLACAAHVMTYTLTALVALVAVALASGGGPAAWRIAIGLAVSAITHYIADRRGPLHRMCRWLGKDEAWLTKGGGYYYMDQSWHAGWLFVAALIIGT